ncbi:hypothetical protein BJV74DRAFT_282029 [Russula compacta]|nr:hypothetical protein BJV74DRAFT_282029 [Russula compacta]
MSANFNPYVQGWRVGNAPSNGGTWGNPSGEPPSIFGALPGSNGNRGAGRRSPPAPDATVFYITDFRPNVLNASVIDVRGRQCYKIVTDASQPHRTVYYDTHRRTVALIDWAGAQPSVEMPGLLPRQALRSWLRTASNRTSRMMEIRGIPHIWVPDGDYICLYYAQRPNVQRLGRICLNRDAVQVELSQHAMEARLAEVCILSASIFLSGFNID